MTKGETSQIVRNLIAETHSLDLPTFKKRQMVSTINRVAHSIYAEKALKRTGRGVLSEYIIKNKEKLK